MRRIPIVLLVWLGLGCTRSKDDWRGRVEPLLIRALCEPQQYFRQCFDIDEATCRRVMAEEVRGCLDKLVLPAHIDRDAGERLGREAGACTGQAFEQRLIAQRRPGGKCDDAAAWGPPQ